MKLSSFDSRSGFTLTPESESDGAIACLIYLYLTTLHTTQVDASTSTPSLVALSGLRDISLRKFEEREKKFTTGESDPSHFLTCAKNGEGPGASGGEKRCRRIREAIEGLEADLRGIDPRAVEGATEHLRKVAAISLPA